MDIPTDREEFKEWLLEQFRSDPEWARSLHRLSDVDYGARAQHHTLGKHPSQAKAGNA